MTQTSAMDRSRQAEIRRSRLGRQPEIGLEAIMQPTPDVVAGRPAAPDDFVMAAAAAEIARPAGLAGLLPVDMPRGQPIGLAGEIDSLLEPAPGALPAPAKKGTTGQVAPRGNPQ